MARENDEGGIMSTADRLIYMTNQIARNLASKGHDGAVSLVEDHIRCFWDPAMRTRIVELARDHPGALSPVAAAAIQRIADS